jgi:Holliday junction DNA helicase RuvA
LIGRLTGKVLECRPDRLVLDVGGVGYELRVPLSTFYCLPREAGAPVTLQVHTHVREDALVLFGFATPEERTAFELLISISGVGPRLALAILSGIGVDDLATAVARQDRPRLQGIPGVGKKTAERVLLELRDKMGPAGEDLPDELSPASRFSATGQDGERGDAVSALVNLGYTRDRAARAVDASLESLGAGARLEELLRNALGRLVR